MTVKAVTSKRMTALIDTFMLQSFCIFMLVLYTGITLHSKDLYIVAFIMLLLKVFLIPYFLHWVAGRIKIDENIGLLLNPLISLLITGFLSYFCYAFSLKLLPHGDSARIFAFGVSLLVVLEGMFIMIFRMKAIAQVIGLLVMENGLFLCAVSLCGSMPFIVEIAIFFDVFVCVMVTGVFIYRINELFTHIDVDKLTSLKG
jgi:hydrogenase-4 component E